MSEEDGFKMALELSKREEEARQRGGKTLAPPEVPKNEFQDMMMDTAGFQKILELSKKEEEERTRK